MNSYPSNVKEFKDLSFSEINRLRQRVGNLPTLGERYNPPVVDGDVMTWSKALADYLRNELNKDMINRELEAKKMVQWEEVIHNNSIETKPL